MLRQFKVHTYVLWMTATLASTLLFHPLLSPDVPLWFVLVGWLLLDSTIYALWLCWPRLWRIVRRLPRAHAIGVYAWKQQAAVERARKAERHARREREYVRWLGGGYQPRGPAVDRSTVTPPPYQSVFVPCPNPYQGNPRLQDDLEQVKKPEEG